VYRILVSEQQVDFEIYLAGRTDAIEGWSWRSGRLQGPREIAAAPLAGGRFAFNDVRLAAINPLVQRAKQRARVGAPAVERASVVIRRGLPSSRALRIRVAVSGPGGERVFLARPSGQPVAGP
jgi:hypothetical protein